MKEVKRLKALASYLVVIEGEVPVEDNVDNYIDVVENNVAERDLPLFNKEKAISYSERLRRNHHELSD